MGYASDKITAKLIKKIVREFCGNFTQYISKQKTLSGTN